MSEIDINKLEQTLQGSSMTLGEGLEEQGFEWEDMTQEDHKSLAMEIFRCEICGWWFERCEESEEQEEHCDGCGIEV